MNIFLSIFAVSTTFFFFFFSLSVAYSWIFYLSATIHKDYMFLFCNTLLVFICVNARLSVAEKKQAAGCCESRSPNGRRTVGDDGVVIAGDDDDDEKAGRTLLPVVEEIHGDDNDEKVAGNDQIPLVNGADELEAVEDDRTLSAIEETMEDYKTLSVIKEAQDDEPETEEGERTPLVVELEAMKNDKTLLEETRTDDEQGDRIDTISLEELNRKCEEFIRRMKKDIRVEIQTVQCHKHQQNAVLLTTTPYNVINL